MQDRALGILFAVILCLAALLANASRPDNKTIGVNAKQRSENAVHNKKSAQEVSPSSKPSTTLHGQDEQEPENADEYSTESWPPFFGFRLKVTDSLLVLFTALLAWSTWGLQASTSGLQRAADEQAKITDHLFFVDQRPWLTLNGKIAGRAQVNARSNIIFTVAVTAENVGKTPAVEAAEGSTGLIFGEEALEQELDGLRNFTRTQSANVGRTIFPKQPASWTINFSVNRSRLDEVFETGLGAPQIFIAACWLYKSPMRPNEFMETTKVFMLQGGIFRSDLRSTTDIRTDDLRLGLVEARETIT